ncbi:uncharacterized protein ISCGN_000351 [Ixodes scapularis]
MATVFPGLSKERFDALGWYAVVFIWGILDSYPITDWALMKNKWDEGDPDRMVKAKQRIRAAFSRHRFVQRLPMKSLAFRLYRIRGFKSFVTCQKKPEGKAEPKLRSATPTGLFTGPVSWPMSEFVEEFVWFFDEFEIFSNDMSLPRPWWWEDTYPGDSVAAIEAPIL